MYVQVHTCHASYLFSQDVVQLWAGSGSVSLQILSTGWPKWNWTLKPSDHRRVSRANLSLLVWDSILIVFKLFKYACISALNKKRCNDSISSNQSDYDPALCLVLFLYMNQFIWMETFVFHTGHCGFLFVFIPFCETRLNQQVVPSAFYCYTNLITSYWPSSVFFAWPLSHTCLNSRAALKCVSLWCFQRGQVVFFIRNSPCATLELCLKALNLGNNYLNVVVWCYCMRNISTVGKRKEKVTWFRHLAKL